MPLDDATGCIAVVFRFFAFIAQCILESAPLECVGWVGKWVMRGLTMGRYRGTSDDLGSVMAGLFVVIALVALGIWLF